MAIDKAPESILKLSLAEKVLQLLFPGFRFGSDDPAEAERLVELGVGGFCLYEGSVPEVAEFTRRLQGRARVPLLFCADYEDGITKHVSGGTALPSNMAIGASGNPDWARRKAFITAVESRAIGVRWVLAPVLDIATQPLNPIVNIRSFGAAPELVGRMGRAFIRGLADGKTLSCAKHFPGHGRTEQDSHLQLPLLKLTRAQLLKQELIPFKNAGLSADAVMMAHLYIPALTNGSKTPTSLSAKAISILRRDMKYRGLIVTDALSMNAIAMHFKEVDACAAALAAGADILLVPAKPLQAAYALPGLLDTDARLAPLVESAYRRLEKAKEACGLFADRGIAPEKDLQCVGGAEHRAEAERMAADCITWVSVHGQSRSYGRNQQRREPVVLSGSVRYLEPDADGPQQWQGKSFISELESRGIQVKPYNEKERADSPVIVSSFVRPRAYSGRIQFSPPERRRAQAAMTKNSNSVLVSFGSPFVLDQLRGYRAGLCAFSEIEAAQKAAARVLVGAAKAPGKMPV